jgi:hypothetical protein
MKNVKRLVKSATATATATATNEIANVELANDLMLFVGLALDYSAHKLQAMSCKMAMTPHIERYRASGYTSISAGAKGRSKVVPVPASNELPYTLVVACFTGLCSERGISYDNTTKLSGGKTQWQNAKNQFLASFKLALQTGEWDNNVSRATAENTTENTAENTAEKEKSKKGTRAPSVFDAKKIADNMAAKYTTSQMKAIIVELQALVA